MPLLMLAPWRTRHSRRRACKNKRKLIKSFHKARNRERSGQKFRDVRSPRRRDIGTSGLSGAEECSKAVDKFNSDGHVSDETFCAVVGPKQVCRRTARNPVRSITGESDACHSAPQNLATVTH